MPQNPTAQSAIMLSDAELEERCLAYNGDGKLQAELHVTWERFGDSLVEICAEILAEEHAMQSTAGLSSIDRKSTRLNSSHIQKSRMPSSA